MYTYTIAESSSGAYQLALLKHSSIVLYVLYGVECIMIWI
jgi:hypothetical protein